MKNNYEIFSIDFKSETPNIFSKMSKVVDRSKRIKPSLYHNLDEENTPVKTEKKFLGNSRYLRSKSRYLKKAKMLSKTPFKIRRTLFPF